MATKHSFIVVRVSQNSLIYKMNDNENLAQHYFCTFCTWLDWIVGG